ncbi:hypothetical protein BDV96DRAFT_664034 [Lophiotrema nucula]|uniref:DUF4246 domain-containing protein n=1 Tax=Lophiotrema nucula TaxID=690887 RepID=A0A6A5Z126_9PLEO|nr:hypothetical protein BDV96DRAFT_664034 [Lophiotrema nucula]
MSAKDNAPLAQDPREITADNCIKLPGFRQSVEWWGPLGRDDLFPSAVYDWYHNPFTWNCKFQDEAIVARWKAEAMTLDWDTIGIERGDFTEEMLNYVIALLEKYGFVPVLDMESSVLKADGIIPYDVKQSLKDAVALLEEVPEPQKDWHLGLDGKVLDLVYPSLYLLVYGRSRILLDLVIILENCTSSIGKGEIILDPEDFKKSEKPQDDEKNARIDSYNNNLHPADYKDLYHVIDNVITKVVSLWNIIYQHYSNNLYILGDGMRLYYDDFKGYAPDDYTSERVLDFDENLESDERYERDDEYDDWLSDNRFQVFVKLANIYLTPEKPEYDGGSWHIEGQLNEHICATALYYYDNDNIIDLYLAFRTKVYDQGEYMGIGTAYGIKSFDENVRTLGAYRVEKFKLTDPIKSGHCKVLALFLRDWWLREIKTGGGRVGNLPDELLDMIGEGVYKFLFGVEVAKRIRKELMTERGELD